MTNMRYGFITNEKPRFYVKINWEGQAKAELLICSPGIKAPAMQAVRKQAAEPEMNALNATSDMAALLVGAKKDKAAIWTPTDAGFENPQRANVVIATAREDKAA